MQEIIEPAPSERDEQIYEAWQSGKTLRTLAREFGTSVTEVDRAIDRCLPEFTAPTRMRAYKREVQRLEDIGSKYHAQAMAGDIDSGHLYARINERYCAMQGWSSINIRMDPYSVQSEQQPTRYDRISEVITRIARRHNNGSPLPPPLDGQNRSETDASREDLATGTDRERNMHATWPHKPA